MCQNNHYYQIISYLCTAKCCNTIATHNFAAALIVQRIERGFPKPKIWVRFPVGVQRQKVPQENLGALLLFSEITALSLD